MKNSKIHLITKKINK